MSNKTTNKRATRVSSSESNTTPISSKKTRNRGGGKRSGTNGAPGSNNTGKQTNTGRSSARKTKKDQVSKSADDKTSRPAALCDHLSKLWDVPNRKLNDDYIIDCISGVRNTDLSLWTSLRIQQYRICTNLSTKIKTSKPLKGVDVTAKEFADTQIDFPVSRRYPDLVRSKLSSIFKDFPYSEVLREIENPYRRRIITNGSSWPQIIAPIIKGDNTNITLICGMVAGRDIYKSDFDINSILAAEADGKFTTVPKNYKTGRGITIASRELIDNQYVISDYLRDWITKWSRTSNHITQFDDQSIQWNLLLQENSTIDLSSASDRVYRSLISYVWPEFMEHFGKFLPNTILMPSKNVLDLTCIGTQGFPLTFTVMAILCGAIVSACKSSDTLSSNYGDDIIVNTGDFEEIYIALESLGLKVNKKKTFKGSHGFIESCGRDIMFTRSGPRDITPVYLRGTSDSEVVQFFYQLRSRNLIQDIDATSIMDRMNVKYFAFEYDYQVTEFHYPFGDIKHLPKPKWSYDRSQYIATVPFLKQEISSVKGLSKKDSDDLLELLKIEGIVKDPSSVVAFVRGSDPVARPYIILDLEEHRLYGLYKCLDSEDLVHEVFYQELEEAYKVSFKTLCFYRFVTSELYRYRFSTYTDDFNHLKIHEYSLRDLIDEINGVKPIGKYSIFKYNTILSYKPIPHPLTGQWLDLPGQ